MLSYSQVTGVGSFVPDIVVPNSYFESYLDTTNEWIVERTGIHSRRHAKIHEGESTTTLAHHAAERALVQSKVQPKDIDMILVATVTQDTVMPTVANELQSLLGCKKAFTLDLQAACSGFLYGLHMADQCIKAGSASHALIVGADTLSTIMDWTDRATSILFSDAAGAVVLSKGESKEHAVLKTKLYSNGDLGHLLSIPHGYSKIPPYHPNYQHKMRTIQMKGKEIFKYAVRHMIQATRDVLEETGYTTNDVDFFLFHQANIRIIETCRKELGIPEEKSWVNLDQYGNSSAATLPLCLDEAMKANKVGPGSLILLTTFGGGITWASSLIRL